MLNHSPYRAIGVAGVSAVALVGVVSAQAMRSAGSDGMDQLLLEVRGIRAELTQAAGASMQMQLLVARLSVQEQRIAALNRQSAEVQQQLATAVRERSATVENLNHLTTAIQSNVVPADAVGPEALAWREGQKQMEYEMASLKARLAEQQEHELRLQTQLAEISAVISTEQGRWNDFNSRLDELERSLPTAAPRQ